MNWRIAASTWPPVPAVRSFMCLPRRTPFTWREVCWYCFTPAPLRCSKKRWKIARIVVDVTAWYWHFMALLWLYIFALWSLRVSGTGNTVVTSTNTRRSRPCLMWRCSRCQGVYEPSLFGTYSKKIGMWLFLLSDSLTFGALLFAYTYGRISTPDWPTPFHSESIRNATHDCVPAHQFADHGVCGARGGHGKPESAAPVAAGHHGVRPGIRRPARPRVDQSHRGRLDLPSFPLLPAKQAMPSL